MSWFFKNRLIVTGLVGFGIWNSVQGAASNPFAPLDDVMETANSVGSHGTEANAQYYAAIAPPQGIVAGILWHRDRPVAIVNDAAVTVGSHLGPMRVTAIQPTAVQLADTTGQLLTWYPHNLLVTETATGSQDPNGECLSVHLDDVSCRTALEALAYQAGLNLVFVGEADERVRLHLQNVTWETALQAVVQAGVCTLTRQGRTLTITDRIESLETETFYLNHGKSTDLEAAVNKLISEQGKVGVDERLNALVVTDTPEYLERIHQALIELDTQAPQVLIEVLIVNVILNDERKMGVDWQVIGSKNAIESLTLTQELNATGLTNPYGAVDFFTVNGDWSFHGLFDFVQSHENVKVLASPKVLVLNNCTATIDAVEEIPYQELSETSGGGVIGTTAFKEAGVKLQVTPQITDDGYILMHILPEQSARVGTYTVDGTDTPIIETRKTETQLRVRDGQTVIIGGLRKKEPFRKESRIPLLGDIPLLGKLFRQVHLQEADSELGVFITPRLYREEVPEDTDLSLVESPDDLATLWQSKVMKSSDRKSKDSTSSHARSQIP